MRPLRTIVHDLAKRVVQKLENPRDAILQIQFQPAVATALRIALDAGWLDALCDGQAHKASSLLKEHQDLELLVRVFRLLTAAGVVVETGETTYQANAKTVLACETGTRAGLAHWFDNMAPTFTTMPEYFRSHGYLEPQEQKSGPYSSVFNKTYWDRLTSEPRLYNDLNTYMISHKKAGTSLVDMYPTDKLAVRFDTSNSDVLLIDVGGGKGHQLQELAAQHSSLPGKLVVQDLQTALPSEADATGFTCMPHNFFEPQPVRGAKYYYLSSILHDWPDEECRKILRHTVQAMVPGYSRILINGIILPAQKASLFEACKDFGMMAAMSAKERTLKQLEGLGTSQGLRVVGVFRGPKGRDGILEFELPQDANVDTSPQLRSSGSQDEEQEVKEGTLEKDL